MSFPVTPGTASRWHCWTRTACSLPCRPPATGATTSDARNLPTLQTAATSFSGWHPMWPKACGGTTHLRQRAFGPGTASRSAADALLARRGAHRLFREHRQDGKTSAPLSPPGGVAAVDGDRLLLRRRGYLARPVLFCRAVWPGRKGNSFCPGLLLSGRGGAAGHRFSAAGPGASTRCPGALTAEPPSAGYPPARTGSFCRHPCQRPGIRPPASSAGQGTGSAPALLSAPGDGEKACKLPRKPKAAMQTTSRLFI